MPITVGYEPMGAIGQLANYAGQGQFNQQQTENVQRGYQLALQQQGQALDYQQSVNAINAQMQMQAAQQANQRYMQEVEGQYGLTRDQQRYEYGASDNEQDRALRAYQGEQEQFLATQKAMVDSGDFRFDYSPKQKQQMAQLHDSMDRINSDPSLTPQERTLAFRQANAQMLQIKPRAMPQEKGPSVEEWANDNIMQLGDGVFVARDSKNNPRFFQPRTEKAEKEKPTFTQKDIDAARKTLAETHGGQLLDPAAVPDEIVTNYLANNRKLLDAMNQGHRATQQQGSQPQPSGNSGQLPHGQPAAQQPAPQQPQEVQPWDQRAAAVPPAVIDPQNATPAESSQYGQWMMQHAMTAKQPMSVQEFMDSNMLAIEALGPDALKPENRKAAEDSMAVLYKDYLGKFEDVKRIGIVGLVPPAERNDLMRQKRAIEPYMDSVLNNKAKTMPRVAMRRLRQLTTKFPEIFPPQIHEWIAMSEEQDDDE